MFFDDIEPVKRKTVILKELPPVPETGWLPPREFPNLRGNCRIIGIDTETKEFDELDTYGPGWARGRGHIVGVSLAAEDNNGNRGAWYFPMRHEIGGELNMNVDSVLAYLRYTLAGNEPKVGANFIYDLGHLDAEGVTINGPLHDPQFAESCIDNNAMVALEILSNKYLGTGKESATMYDWIRQAYPFTPETKLRREIFRTPPQLVGKYAEADALQPIDILRKQFPIMQRDGVDYVYRLECDIMRVMLAMRKEGVTVDIKHTERLIEELQPEIAQMYQTIHRDYGVSIESTSNANLAYLFRQVGIDYQTTEAGNGQFQKEWLAALEHPLGKLVNDIREHEKMIGTFLRGYILNKNINGKLYPQFHQMRGESGGTKVGRFASSTPNLQNIPSRTKLGKRIREAFVADLGHSHWLKLDYSQIHYRILAHNAVGPGSDELRERYINDPATDYHRDVYNNVAPLLGWSTTDADEIAFRRRPVKNVNFGLLYGQSEKALAFKSGLSGDDAKAFFKAYFLGAPYVKPTMKMIEAEMQKCGYTVSLLGRRTYFTEFEPDRETFGRVTPLPYRAALAKWGHPLKYAYGYRAVNYRFQSSEPDIMKEGMRDLYNSGVWDYTGVPRLTVHDECDYSVPHGGEMYEENGKKKWRCTGRMKEAFDFIQQTMQNAVKMRVPVYADMSQGINWGRAD